MARGGVDTDRRLPAAVTRNAAPVPRLMVVADVDAAGGRLPYIVAIAVDHGARAVVLRARETQPAKLFVLASMAWRALEPVGGLLIVAGSGGDSVHLSSQQEFPQPRPSLVGRSCHTADEVDRAVAEGCDYAFVSPVYPTASKPGYGPALGPAGLAALCRPGLPVYALGGVLPEHVAECVQAGAYGIAVMGPVLRDPTVVADYLAALSEVTT
jgi:thiamine monophosphate synthase